MLAYLVAAVTAIVLVTAAAWFWKRFLQDPDRPGALSALDGSPQALEETAPPAGPLGVRWSWRHHRPSGLRFLRVTVANGGPGPVTVTRVRLRTSDELAGRGNPPGGLLGATDYAAELFPEAAPLPRTLEPGNGIEAYFPCRDVADWLYGVAEGANLDRNECHLTPECVDGDGNSHPARRKVDYEKWLKHGQGPSLRQHRELIGLRDEEPAPDRAGDD